MLVVSARVSTPICKPHAAFCHGQFFWLYGFLLTDNCPGLHLLTDKHRPLMLAIKLASTMLPQMVSRELEKECIVVFDEAHNIDNVCIEALSVNLRKQTLEAARRNLGRLNNVGQGGFSTQAPACALVTGAFV